MNPDPTAPAGDERSNAEARAFLLERKTRGVTFGLERMRRLAAALGNPQEQLRCVHVAGTNGKGSVAAMLDAILRRAGWRTGLYTSPHLIRLGERIQVDRQPLAFRVIAEYVREFRPLVEQIEAEHGREAGPSYFEFMTAIALRHFIRSGCDIAVIEVGLGGGGDATNIVMPDVSVITSIGLDHCEVLGDSVEAIAAHKAGIIKPGRPVVLGRVPAAAERVIRAVAEEGGSALHSVRETFGEEVTAYPGTNLEGEYQRWNAATARLAAGALDPRWRVDATVVHDALQSVEWPGRWQRIIADDRTVIVDTSHNPEGADVLDASLRQLCAQTGRRPIVVTGVLGLSRARAIMAVISRHARELHLVVPAQRRASPIDQLRALVPAGFDGNVVKDAVSSIFAAPGECRIGDPGDTIVVTGSIYLAGEVLARLTGAGSPDSDLQDF